MTRIAHEVKRQNFPAGGGRKKTQLEFCRKAAIDG